jgi:phosphate transport system substrate-binding protein
MKVTKQVVLKKIFSVAVGLGLAASSATFAADITGAGATFPYPIYAKWAEAYKAKTGVGLNYQSIGSSGGVKQIRAKTVDFGATDNPLKAEDLQKDGLVQFPAIIGGVVPVLNVEGLSNGQLKLTGEVLAQIFLGEITKWNDSKITALNAGVKLPDQSITVVHRADGSGTTAIFTDYLTKVSKTWADKVGAGAAVKWLASSAVGGKGNEGVAANVSRVKGSIGYVEYAYAKKNKMNYAQLKNKDGQFVAPDDLTFAAAAANVNWSKTLGMGIFLTNQSGAKTWPIAGASFILIYKDPSNKANAAEVIKFFEWAFKNGQKIAEELDYVPMPASVTDYISKSVLSQVKVK